MPSCIASSAVGHTSLVPLAPVLQAHASAVITASRRRGLFQRGGRTEQRLEVQQLSLAGAEKSLQKAEAGSAIIFVHGTGSQQSRIGGSGGGGGVSASGRRPQLYVSFKYRQTVVHNVCSWLQLKVVSRDSQRTTLLVEQHHLDAACDLAGRFVPLVRAWLAAVVQAPNFIDQPVESVDLRALLHVRHHLVLTRRTETTASIVLCKLDGDGKKIVSTAVVFDFKSRRVRDDSGNTLPSFQEVFQQFLGSHPGQPLASPREEDEEEPQLSMSLLEGLEREELPERKLKRLVRLQGAIRRGCGLSSPRPETAPTASVLEITTTLLLQQLVQHVSSWVSLLGVAKGAASNCDITAAAPMPADQATVEEVSLLACDLLADLCDGGHLGTVGPHIWRICQGYLEDPTGWPGALAALGLLTLMSRELPVWLVQHTDAAPRLFSVLAEAQQFLAGQRTALRSVPTFTAKQSPQRSPALLRGGGAPPPAAAAAVRGLVHATSEAGLPQAATTFSPAASPLLGQPGRATRPRAQSPSRCVVGGATSTGSISGGSTGPPLGMSQPGGPAGGNSAALSGRGASEVALPPMASANCVYCFTPQGGGGTTEATGAPRSSVGGNAAPRSASASSEESTSVVRRASSSGALQSEGSTQGTRRHVKVPPLNLDLAGLAPSPGGNHTLSEDRSTPTPCSMTRSSRRLLQGELTPSSAGTPHQREQSPGATRRVTHSLSAPNLHVRGSGSTIGAIAFGSAAPPRLPPPAGRPPPPLPRRGAPAGRKRGSSSQSWVHDKQATMQAEDLATALGEACLLADLSDLLKYKQERQVHAAVLGTMQVESTSFASAEHGQSGRPPPAQPSSSPMTGSPAGSNATPATSSSAIPGAAECRSSQITAYYRARLYASLVLERLCSCNCSLEECIGPHIPVNRLFEMLSESCSQHGTWSFSVDEDLNSDAVFPHDGSGAGDGGDVVHHIRPERRQQVAEVKARLEQSIAVRCCVCRATATGSGPSEPCMCADDALAASIWRILAVHARHAEAVHRSQVPVLLDGGKSGVGAAAAAWKSLGGAWHTRLANDTFLSGAVRALAQAQLQLSRAKAAAAAATAAAASQDVQTPGLAERQLRLAALLRLCAAYLRRCRRSAVLALQAFQVISPTLSTLKVALCAFTGAPAAAAEHPLPPALAQLWAAYLQLVGALLRCALPGAGGSYFPAFAEVMLVVLLDWPPISSSLPALCELAPAVAAAAGGGRGCSGEEAAAAAAAAPAAAATLAAASPAGPPRAIARQAPKTFMAKSRSLNSLHSVGSPSFGKPSVAFGRRSFQPTNVMRTPSPAHLSPDRRRGSAQSGLGETHTASAASPRVIGSASIAAPAGTPSRKSGSNVWTLLPSILAQLLDASHTEAVGRQVTGQQRATAQPSHTSEERADSVNCRTLLFVESLLELASKLTETARTRMVEEPAGASGELPKRLDALNKMLFKQEGQPTPAVPVAKRASLAPEVSVAKPAAVSDRCQSSSADGALGQAIIDWAQCLFLPPAGHVCRVAKRQLQLAATPLVRRVVLCELQLFRVPAVVEAPYVQDATVLEYYIRRHFFAFVRLYHSRRDDDTASSAQHSLGMCRLHLEALLAIASLRHQGEGVRRAFQQLAVLDFLAGEVDLENEMTQMRDRFMRATRKQGASGVGLGGGSSARSGGSARTPASSGAQSCGWFAPPQPEALSATAVVGAGQGLRQLPAAAAGEAAPPTEGLQLRPADAVASTGTSAAPPPPPWASAVKQPPRPVALVPKLAFKGLRPSLQGCSGLGAPPPEEPGLPPGGAPPPVSAEISTEVCARECSEQHSATGSTMSTPPTQVPRSAYSGAQDDDDDSADSTSDSTGASPRPSGDFAGAEDRRTAEAAGVQETCGQSAPLPTLPEDRSALHGSNAARSVAAEAVAILGGPPRRAPPVVPRLSINQILAGALQGEQSGAPTASPATGRSSQTTPSSSTRASRLGSDRKQTKFALSPGGPLVELPVGGGRFSGRCPPSARQQALASTRSVQSNGITSSSGASTTRSQDSPGRAASCGNQIAARPPQRLSVPKLAFFGLRPSLQGCSGLGAAPPEEPTSSPAIGTTAPPAPPAANVHRPTTTSQLEASLPPPPPSESDSDSSTEGRPADAEETQSHWFSSRLKSNSFASDNTRTSEAQAAPDSSDEEEEAAGPTEAAVRHLPVPMPRPGLGSKPAFVPKLTFGGLRPSLQGCSGLGAPPPEEPSEAANPVQQAPPVPPAAPSTAQGSPASAVAKPLAGASAGPLAVADSPLRPPSTASCSGRGSAALSSAPATDRQPPSSAAGSVADGGAAGSHEGDLNCAGVVHENVFYFQGRQRRRVYEDEELHALLLTLLLVLLVTPEQGLLDPRYSDQYPLAKHKKNVPFVLSRHLNHVANRPVLPQLFHRVGGLRHSPGVFRVLKLLCETAMHCWMYTGWTRLAGGAFGTVYQCSVELGGESHGHRGGTGGSESTTLVAVKQLPKQSNIQDRCVFFDVFSEIACLDTIRFEDHLCHLYDYGVDESGYWIAMRHYGTTLKKWREAMQGSTEDNLPVLLAIYQQILAAVGTLHKHGIIHYDLKCENIMVELDKDPVLSPTSGMGSKAFKAAAPLWDSLSRGGPPVPRIALVDFGESRMTVGDELDTRNRGTELVKCPEMLELEKFGKKEASFYDRRKRVGTDRAADIWSAGCLLFELLTGRYLFQDDDFGMFWARTTGRMGSVKDGDVVSEANERLLEGRTPLIEFIRFMLVRDPQRRPTVAAATRRFEAAAQESLRNSTASAAFGVATPACHATSARCDGDRSTSFGATQSLPSPQSARSSSAGGLAVGRTHGDGGPPRSDRLVVCGALCDAECCLTQVLQDLCVLEVSDEALLEEGAAASSGGPRGGGGVLRQRLQDHSWTHIVDFRIQAALELPQHLTSSQQHTLVAPWRRVDAAHVDEEALLQFLPAVLDFLRHAAVRRGTVLFADGRPGGHASSGGAGSGLAFTAVLGLISEVYRVGIYEALSFLSSTLLVPALRPDMVGALASWQSSVRCAAWAQAQQACLISCICGSCSWQVPSAWLAGNEAAVPRQNPGTWMPGPAACLVSCNCGDTNAGEAGGPAMACCARGGCQSYARWLHGRFGGPAPPVPSIQWLWLPQGVDAGGYSCGPDRAVLGEGVGMLAEPTLDSAHQVPATQAGRAQQRVGAPSAAAPNIQRFHCRSCQVLTHVLVQEPSTRMGRGVPAARCAIVCSYGPPQGARHEQKSPATLAIGSHQLIETGLAELLLPPRPDLAGQSCVEKP